MALHRTRAIISSTAPPPAAASAAQKTPFVGFDAPAPSWGTQRFARCAAVVKPYDRLAAAPRSAARPPEAPAPAPETEPERLGPPDLSEISAVRERLTLDLQKASEEITLSLLSDEPSAAAAAEEEERLGEADVAAATARRRSRGEGRKANSPRRSDRCDRSDVVLRPRRGAPEKKVYFSPQLTCQEIVEDFIAMTGRAPPSRPKRRPKSEKNIVESLFPGFGLSPKVKAQDYEVTSPPEPGQPKKAGTKKARAS